MKIFAKGWSNDYDGPGRRFVYYLKGCNFNCLWCGSPESISAEAEMLFYPAKSSCTELCCDKGAVKNGRLQRAQCSQCLDRPCINIWHNPAFEFVGEELTPKEIIRALEERRPLWGNDGGVTFSGGEPSLQLTELIEVATALKKQGIHLTIETNASTGDFNKIREFFDLIICDLKCITPQLHREMTGTDNRNVLSNITAAANANQAMIVRIPLISELNFTLEEQAAFLQFFRKVKPAKVELLRLHKLATPKYIAMNKMSPFEQLHSPKKSAVNKFITELKKIGIKVQLVN